MTEATPDRPSPIQTALAVVAAALHSPFVALVDRQGSELRILDNQRQDGLNGLVLALPASVQGRLAASERREAARLHALIAQLDTPLLVVLSDEQSVLFNPAAAELVDLPQRVLRPMEVASRLQAFFADCGDQVQATLRSLETEPGATVHVGFERQGRHWEVLSRRINDPALDGRFWLFTDITQGVQQQQLLMAGMHNETIARISGGMAHQFNNLLTVILGNAEVLSEYPGLDQRAQRQLGNLLKAAETGADIIAELLAHGQRQACPGEVFDAAEECRVLLPLFRQLLPPSVELQTEGLAGRYPLRCDRKLFADALVHAVLNARDALTDKGRVAIRLESTWSTVGSTQGDVYLRVEDNGHGMDESTRRRAFEPFFTTRGMASSRGLGLSVVEGFVSASGGRVSLGSDPGKGTVLEMVLPLSGSSPERG